MSSLKPKPHICCKDLDMDIAVTIPAEATIGTLRTVSSMSSLLSLGLKNELLDEGKSEAWCAWRLFSS